VLVYSAGLFVDTCHKHFLYNQSVPTTERDNHRPAERNSSNRSSAFITARCDLFPLSDFTPPALYSL